MSRQPDLQHSLGRVVPTGMPVGILNDVVQKGLNTYLCKGILSEIRTKLRDWAVGQVGAGCYSWAALSSNDSETLYRSGQSFCWRLWGNVSKLQVMCGKMSTKILSRPHHYPCRKLEEFAFPIQNYQWLRSFQWMNEFVILWRKMKTTAEFVGNGHHIRDERS